MHPPHCSEIAEMCGERKVTKTWVEPWELDLADARTKYYLPHHAILQVEEGRNTEAKPWLALKNPGTAFQERHL